MSRIAPRAALLASLAGVSAVAAESVVVRFDPPSGAAFVERELQSTEIRLGGNRELHTTAILSAVGVRREGGVTYVTHRYDEIAGAKEGEKFSTPPQIEAMKGSSIVHVFRPDGAMLRVDGYAKIADKALPLMKPEAREALRKMIAEGRQDANDRAGWFDVEMLIGQTLELDRDYWFQSAWSEESGWARHDTLVRLGPWVDHPTGGRLLTANFAYVPNARAAVPNATHLTPRLASRFDPARVAPVNVDLRIEGSGSLLLDPATSVVWKSQTWRKISEPMRVSGDLAVTIVTETRSTKTIEPAAKPAAN